MGGSPCIDNMEAPCALQLVLDLDLRHERGHYRRGLGEALHFLQ